MDAPASTPLPPAQAVEFTYDDNRDEFNLIVRRPFWLNLRVGGTQNALWFGRRIDRPGKIRCVFNWFPTPWSAYSVTLGRTAYRATALAMLRDLNQQVDLIRHPNKITLFSDTDAPDSDLRADEG